MDIQYKCIRNTLYIFLNGELDEFAAKSARTDLDCLIGEHLFVRAVVFDLSGLAFMDSTGLGLLIGRYKLLNKYNIPAYIQHPTIPIEKILILSGLYDIMPKI